MSTKSTKQLTAGLVAGETSAAAIAESAVNAAEKLNDSLHAFLEIDRAGSLSRSQAIDERSDKSTLTLAGVPIAVKDNICVKGFQTSCGSRILGSYKPPYDATAIDRLIDAGAVVIGKTNCDE